MTPRAVPPLARRAFAEFLGTGLLVTVVIGSGIAAARLSPTDTGLALLENAAATAAGLSVIILLVGPVSGAHLNPVVSLADAVLGRRRGTGLTGRELAVYLPAQLVGAAAGAVLANLMFDLQAVSLATTDRSAAHLLLGEIVATAGLVALVFALARNGKTSAAPAAIGAYIGAAYWFTRVPRALPTLPSLRRARSVTPSPVSHPARCQDSSPHTRRCSARRRGHPTALSGHAGRR